MDGILYHGWLHGVTSLLTILAFSSNLVLNMASKVLSVLLGVLVLTGCAGMGSQTLKPEKLFLDWKDFYPADFVQDCNQSHTTTGMFKNINRYCYRTNYANSDMYSLIVDVTTFKPGYQLSFDTKDKKKHLSEIVNAFIQADCAADVTKIHDNAYSCHLSNGSNMLVVTNYVVGNSKVAEARLVLFPDQLSNLTSEYQTSMRIISDNTLKQFLSD